MNQYIELYDSEKELIGRNSAGVLNECRDAARETLNRVGLAKEKDFSATDPEAMLAADYAMNLNRFEVPVTPSELFTCDVPNLSTQVHYLINEQYVVNAKLQPLKAEGVYVGSLRSFANEHPDTARKYYNQLVAKVHNEAPYTAENQMPSPVAPKPVQTPCSEGESALNTMLCQDGFVLYVPQGTKVEKPIQLISLLRSFDDFMACQRLLIIVEDHAEATLLICDHASEGKTLLQSLEVTEIFVGEGAKFEYYALEEHNSQVRRLNQIYLSQAADSNVSLGQFSLTAGQTRNRCHIALEGENAKIQLFGMVIADGNQRVDNITYIDHKKPNCSSNELFKYVLDEEAQGSFIGRILVREGAIKTDAHQTDRNLCISPKAHMLARPELEIYADDVKCSHGATVGQLDAQALFYMQTRGISKAEAQLLLMFAFMGDVIDMIQLEPLKDRLKQLVEKRFRKEMGHCNTCKIKK